MIRRFEFDYEGMELSEDGDWVRYEDHVAEANERTNGFSDILDKWAKLMREQDAEITMLKETIHQMKIRPVTYGHIESDEYSETGSTGGHKP